MKRNLGDIADIQFGPYITSHDEGDIKYLTASHFDEFQAPSRFKESFVSLDSKNKKHLLKPNDVILTGKGYRIFAWSYDPDFGLSIPSSLFYRLRTNPNQILADYLSLYLNTNKMKYQLELLGAGATILSIPKKELENLDINIPSLNEQHRIVDLIKIIDRDISISQEILDNKQQLRGALIDDLIINKNLN